MLGDSDRLNQLGDRIDNAKLRLSASAIPIWEARKDLLHETMIGKLSKPEQTIDGAIVVALLFMVLVWVFPFRT